MAAVPRTSFEPHSAKGSYSHGERQRGGSATSSAAPEPSRCSISPSRTPVLASQAETSTATPALHYPPTTPETILHRDDDPLTAQDLPRDTGAPEDDLDSPTPSPPPPTALTLRLYISHFLSTWNARLFEFGAVLFLASIYPSTLLPMSVYALSRSAAAIVFSPAVGSYIDKGDRLQVVRLSIVGQRVAVAASCGIFWVLERRSDAGGTLKNGLFGLSIVLACVEKLCAVMNAVAVERDWVVVITEGNEPVRRVMNARMRRIDLFCKLFGPLVIALIDGRSTLIAVWVTLAMSAASVLVEYFTIARVYKLVPGLRRSPVRAATPANDGVNSFSIESAPRRSPALDVFAWLRSVLTRVLPLRSLSFYSHHPAFLPSVSLSLLYLTVLSFSGQMITFLLFSGYTSTHVGIARTVSTVLEMSATWIAPRVMARIGATRGGIWFLFWQMVWLAGGVSLFFGEGAGQGKREVIAASGLVAGVALSRVGLWGFDLCAQNIVQDEVDSDHRGAFSTVEASFQNMFELLSYATTIIFSRPDQFKWPVVVSVAAVYAAGGLYTTFVRRRRGHLLHASRCIRPKD